jgi:hypothetical protein
VAALAIALSILVHGTTATPVMLRFGRPAEEGEAEADAGDGARSDDDAAAAPGDRVAGQTSPAG